MADFQFPRKLEFLLTHKARFKVAHGGRGGAKTTSFAKALLTLAMKMPLRVLCAREYQNSLADSVYKILCDIIRANDLEGFFTILHDSIRAANGGEFRFMGIMTNPTKIKSFEGVDICWIAEAANISEEAFDILEPTIRKGVTLKEPEIWIEFNPDGADDYIYKTFVVAKIKPPRSIVVQINYTDVPDEWFPLVLRESMEHCKAIDYDKYLNVWLGQPKRVLKGAVYAEEIRQALAENRVGPVPWDPTVPVHVFTDLGWADYTALWFVQKVGLEYHIIDYLADRLKPMRYYFSQMQAKSYNYGTIWLPHDAESKSLGTGLTINDLFKKAGYRTLIVPRLKVDAGINAVREIFPRCYFDAETTAKGFDALCKYHWNDKAPNKRTPVHDDASHGSDGFRYFAVSIAKGIAAVSQDVMNPDDWAALRARPVITSAFRSGDAWMSR